MSRILMRSLLALALVFGLALTGLAVPSEAAKARKDIKIIFVPKTNKIEYWRNSIKGFNQACKALGIQCSVQAPLKPYNSEEQISILENIISGKKADGILLAPNSSQAVIPAIQQANKAGIPVATTTTGAYGGDVLVHVEANFFTMAKVGAERAIKEMGGKGNVVIIEGFPGQTSPEETKEGFLAAIREANGGKGLDGPKVKLLGMSPGFYQRPFAQKVMEDFLTKFPKIDYILTANDDMTLGAVQAIRVAGRGKEAKAMGGIGGQLMGAQAIKKGDMTFTVWANEGMHSYMATSYLVDFIATGKRPPSRYVDVGYAFMAPENVDKYIKLNAWDNVYDAHKELVGMKFNYKQPATSMAILEKAKAGGYQNTFKSGIGKLNELKKRVAEEKKK